MGSFCPPGEHWDGSAGSCVPNGPPDNPYPNPPPLDTQTPFPQPIYSTMPVPHPTWKESLTAPGAGGGGAGAPAPAPAGGGGARSTASPAPVFAVPGNDIEKLIWDQIQGIINGTNAPYSEDVLNRNKGALFSATQGRARADLAASDYDLVNQGLYRSGARSRERGAIRERAAGQYASGVGDLLNQQVQQNYAARVQALNQAKDLLDSQRQFILGKEGNDVQKQIGLAQVNLGYARLNQEMQMLQMQLGARGGGGQGGLNFNGVNIPPGVLDLLMGLIGGGGGSK